MDTREDMKPEVSTSTKPADIKNVKAEGEIADDAVKDASGGISAKTGKAIERFDPFQEVPDLP